MIIKDHPPLGFQPSTPECSQDHKISFIVVKVCFSNINTLKIILRTIKIKLSMHSIQSNILNKPYTTSKDCSIPESSENGIRLLRYYCADFTSLFDLPIDTSAGPEINLDHSPLSLKKFDLNEPKQPKSDSTTTSVLLFPFSIVSLDNSFLK